MQRTAMTNADPVNPMRIFWELTKCMPSNAIITADSGSSANWYARHLRFTNGVRGSLSGTLATMGPGVPYAIGAKWAHPDRPGIAFVGDGAMQMNGMNELITIARYWRQWADPRLVVVVLHNNDLNQVTWEMRAMEGSPKFAESQTLPDVDYARFARGLDLRGDNIEDPAQIASAWDRALSADRPTVLDVRCDPDVPPIPRTPRSTRSHRWSAPSSAATKTPPGLPDKASNRNCSSMFRSKSGTGHRTCVTDQAEADWFACVRRSTWTAPHALPTNRFNLCIRYWREAHSPDRVGHRLPSGQRPLKSASRKYRHCPLPRIVHWLSNVTPSTRAGQPRNAQDPAGWSAGNLPSSGHRESTHEHQQPRCSDDERDTRVRTEAE